MERQADGTRYQASELTDAEQREFIIKDNVGFGEWDMDALANEWDNDDLVDWGVDVWQEDNAGGSSDGGDMQGGSEPKTTLNDRFVVPPVLYPRHPERLLASPEKDVA